MAGIYIHIPFCLQKCGYCDFYSIANAQMLLPQYMDALMYELDSFAELTTEPFDTVFLGGGTPSLLSGEQVLRLMKHLRAEYALLPEAEITMECNPGTIHAKKLHAYREAGINRLSLGVQSLDDELLRRIGRIHTAAEARSALLSIRDAGFQTYNADLMHGLPGQSTAQYLHSLRELIDLGVPHISAYQLTLEAGTPLHSAIKNGTEALPDEAIVYTMQDDGMELLARHGYERYEISNFALPGHACRHNINYWKNGMYLGIGAGAHAAWRLPDEGWCRWENAADANAYIESGGEPERTLTRIPIVEEAFETVMLGLRMTQGIELAAFEKRYGHTFEVVYPKAVERLQKAKWLELQDGYAYLTPFGMDMENIALQYFLQ